jgi:hypothetical protein
MTAHEEIFMKIDVGLSSRIEEHVLTSNFCKFIY